MKHKPLKEGRAGKEEYNDIERMSGARFCVECCQEALGANASAATAKFRSLRVFYRILRVEDGILWLLTFL